MYEHILRLIRQRAMRMVVKKQAKRQKGEQINFTECWQEIHRILVCWPETGVDLLAATLILNRIKERFPEAAVTVIAMPGVSASPPDEMDAHVYSIDKNQINWLGIPDRRLKSVLQDMGADAAIDLSPRFDPQSGHFCQLSGAPIRVALEFPEGELVYNYQVRPHQDRLGIDRYRVLAKYIG
jgi:hypothetical protein